jgi:hypothetical protein
MKNRGGALLAGVMSLLFVTNFAMAQGGGLPPPGCCTLDADDEQSLEAASRSQFDISDGAIQRMGLTRSQFIDRLSDAMFPGKEVAIVIRSSRVSSKSLGREQRGILEEDLVAVEETRYYQIARSRMRSEDLSGLAQLYVTDGEIYVKINFIRGDSSKEVR